MIVGARSKSAASFAASQWYAAATSTTPVHVASSREPRAIDFACHADLNGQRQRLPISLCRKHAAELPQTATDCRSPAAPPVGQPCYLADAAQQYPRDAILFAISRAREPPMTL